MRKILALLALGVFAFSACSPTAGGGSAGSQEPSIAPTYDWWFAGDSGFAGVGDYDLGAPSKLDNVHSIAVAGNVLAPVEVLGDPQPLVREQINRAVRRYGDIPPRNIVVHAGGADLLARTLPVKKVPDVADYVAAVEEIDSMYRYEGVEVWWSSTIPFTSWALAQSEVEYRRVLNEAIAEAVGPERFIDCDPVLADNNGRWLREDFALSLIDGAHLNAKGAVAHATCIADHINDALGEEVLALK